MYLPNIGLILHLLVVFRTSTHQARCDDRFKPTVCEKKYIFYNKFRGADLGFINDSGKRTERGAAFLA